MIDLNLPLAKECLLCLLSHSMLHFDCVVIATSKRYPIVAFVKERFHNAVKIDILGIFLTCIHRYKFGPPPKKKFSGAKLFRANDVISIEHMLCSWQESSFTFCLASWCASLSSLTFSFRVVCFLVEFWTVLPCLFMFMNTIAYAFRC